MNIIFAGTPEFAKQQLQALIDLNLNIVAVYTQPDRKSGRGQKLQFSPVKSLAKQHNIPVEQPSSLKSEQALATLQSYAPDVMIVAAYGLLLPKSVLDTPKKGCINVHASLLPKWRGASPIQQAILAGDTTTGITLMQMDEGLDTGSMLAKLECEILSTDTAQTLHDKLATLGANLLKQELANILSSPHPLAQNDNQASYAGKISKSSAKIDWSQPAEYIQRQVRAYNPWPIAFSTLDGENIRFWETALNTDPSLQADCDPGTIMQQNKHSLTVKTQDGKIDVRKLQLPGKKPLLVADLLNSKHYVDFFSVNKRFQ